MIKYLPAEMILEYQSKLIATYGGLPGIRDMGLFLSALEMPRAQAFGVDLHPTLHDKAAAYLYHIVCNHPFYDANKRTGAFCCLVFLKINGAPTNFDNSAFEKLVLKVAKGKANKEQIASFLLS